MMALPRSATKLGRWPWRHHMHGVVDTREGKDKDPLKTGFVASAPEELKAEPIEHNVPIVRTPSKLKKRGPASTSETEARDSEDAPLVDSETAEHVAHQPDPPLVKENSLSKRAASKGTSSEPAENGVISKEVEVQVPTPVVESPGVEKDPVGAEEQPQRADEPVDGANEHGTPVEVIAPDTPAPPLAAPERTPSPSSSQTHPFPVRGVTPPNGTRFFEGTDGSLEPTETRTTVLTSPMTRPARPQRRISLRSFGFFYGKDSRPAHPFPAYVPPAERVVYEEDEVGSIAPSQQTTPGHKRHHSRIPIGLLTSLKSAPPKIPKNDRQAVQSALSLRTLIIGPAALDAKEKNKKGNESKASAVVVLRKVNQQLLVPDEANRVIAALRELPPPDLPPATARTVETVRKKTGWVFGRASHEDEREESLKESPGTVAMPIHGCCLDITDEEAEEKHFSKLTGSAFVGSAAGTEANANTGSADLSSLVPMLKNLRLVNLQASPDLSSVNAASLSARMSAPDLGFGRNADGPLAGSVPTPGSLVDGMEKVGQTLMSLGALLNFLTAFALFSNGVREMLPFIRYIAQFIDFEWNTIKAQDKGRGVVCAATWVMPAALVPRPWDFVDPPMSNKVARSMTPGPATQTLSTTSVTRTGLAPHANATAIAEPAEEAGETNKMTPGTETRDDKPPSIHNNEQGRVADEQKGAESQDATEGTSDDPAAIPEQTEETHTPKDD
ncbi:hypothetical protein FRC11_000012 [Ceratobasidium sp. 423]|nr:hypothetical protein FRC11_000012 [Ceratobasidium sp. 423]